MHLTAAPATALTLYLIFVNLIFNPQQGWSYFLQNTPNFQLLTPNDELLWLIDSIKDIWGLSQRAAAFNYNLVSPLEKTAQNFIKAIILFRVNVPFFFFFFFACTILKANGLKINPTSQCLPSALFTQDSL